MEAVIGSPQRNVVQSEFAERVALLCDGFKTEEERGVV